jgi:hypothetical protein
MPLASTECLTSNSDGWENPSIMAKRTRITTTIREDDPTSRQRRKKNSNAIIVVIALIPLGLALFSHAQGHRVTSMQVSSQGRR